MNIHTIIYTCFNHQQHTRERGEQRNTSCLVMDYGEFSATCCSSIQPSVVMSVQVSIHLFARSFVPVYQCPFFRMFVDGTVRVCGITRLLLCGWLFEPFVRSFVYLFFRFSFICLFVCSRIKDVRSFVPMVQRDVPKTQATFDCCQNKTKQPDGATGLC